MKKINKGTLRLNSETVRALGAKDMVRAAGGQANTGGPTCNQDDSCAPWDCGPGPNTQKCQSGGPWLTEIRCMTL